MILLKDDVSDIHLTANKIKIHLVVVVATSIHLTVMIVTHHKQLFKQRVALMQTQKEI